MRAMMLSGQSSRPLVIYKSARSDDASRPNVQVTPISRRDLVIKPHRIASGAPRLPPSE